MEMVSYNQDIFIDSLEKVESKLNINNKAEKLSYILQIITEQTWINHRMLEGISLDDIDDCYTVLNECQDFVLPEDVKIEDNLLVSIIQTQLGKTNLKALKPLSNNSMVFF